MAEEKKEEFFEGENCSYTINEKNEKCLRMINPIAEMDGVLGEDILKNNNIQVLPASCLYASLFENNELKLPVCVRELKKNSFWCSGIEHLIVPHKCVVLRKHDGEECVLGDENQKEASLVIEEGVSFQDLLTITCSPEVAKSLKEFGLENLCNFACAGLLKEIKTIAEDNREAE